MYHFSEDVLKANPELAQVLGMAKKESKHHNVRTEYEGMLFASRREAERAFFLIHRQAAREIFALCYGVDFPLEGGVVYRADFVYIEPVDGRLEVVIEDVKGWDEKKGTWYQTREFKNKARQFKARYKYEIRLV
jgi:hypothetical protein